jgi:superoxide dismutase, Fe-Mn family
MAHPLPPLAYATDALEPPIDALTMTLHHGTCIATPKAVLNATAAVSRDKHPRWLLETLEYIPAAIRSDRRPQAVGQRCASALEPGNAPKHA